MQTSQSIPHLPWSEVWLPILTFAFGTSVRTLRLWLNRKRSSEVDAGNERTLAEARKIDADASAGLTGALLSMSAKIGDLSNDIDTQRERHEKEIEKARKRVHSAISEVNRCVGTLKHHEILLSERDIHFEPFAVKTYKEIVGDDDP